MVCCHIYLSFFDRKSGVTGVHFYTEIRCNYIGMNFEVLSLEHHDISDEQMMDDG